MNKNLDTSITTDALLADTAVQAGKYLLEYNLRLVCAESCTGGWIAKSCTDIAGCSAWFERGYVTYSNESKQSLLGVSIDTLAQFGAVSAETAKAMAVGALQHSLADISVAVTGIAGPAGESESKPVGTVWFAWAVRDGEVYSECQLFAGNRDQVRRQAVLQALQGIIKNAKSC